MPGLKYFQRLPFSFRWLPMPSRLINGRIMSNWKSLGCYIVSYIMGVPASHSNHSNYHLFCEAPGGFAFDSKAWEFAASLRRCAHKYSGVQGGTSQITLMFTASRPGVVLVCPCFCLSSDPFSRQIPSRSRRAWPWLTSWMRWSRPLVARLDDPTSKDSNPQPPQVYEEASGDTLELQARSHLWHFMKGQPWHIID